MCRERHIHTADYKVRQEFNRHNYMKMGGEKNTKNIDRYRKTSDKRRFKIDDFAGAG